MLSEDSNKLLTQVGPGTPMGELMRRYWQPIAAVSEFDDKPTKPVRVMGEDLVLYKDLSGNFGLVDRQCAHRRADLSYGFVEECGLRCNYHGWLFDHNGNCTQQPYEDTVAPEANLKGQVRLKAYPVEAKAGILWAYMGPQPVPLVPNWEPFTWDNGFVQVVTTTIPCNWFQCQENSIDPVHFEWMHSNWKVRLEGGKEPYAPTHLKVDFEEIDYGFVYKRILENTDETNPLWTIGRVCLWPNCLFTGGHFEWRVPVDDENTLSISWFYNRVPKDREPYKQNSIPHWEGPLEDPETGRWIDTHVMNQDFIAWVGQGTTADRTKEHLGMSDKGIAMIRKRFLDDLKRIEKGEDPKCIIRDEEQNKCLELPIVDKEAFVEGMTLEEIENAKVESRVSANRFVFQAGQPEHVRRAYEEAMGRKMADVDFVDKRKLNAAE